MLRSQGESCFLLNLVSRALVRRAGSDKAPGLSVRIPTRSGVICHRFSGRTMLADYHPRLHRMTHRIAHTPAIT
eukprot:118188-Amorphochlora_amoeboformis.AAC.2